MEEDGEKEVMPGQQNKYGPCVGGALLRLRLCMDCRLRLKTNFIAVTRPTYNVNTTQRHIKEHM